MGELRGAPGWPMKGYLMWKRLTALVAVTTAAIGCSMDVGRDLVACKVKATEASGERGYQSPEYVRNCMVAAGYQLKSSCAAVAVGWTDSSCYQ
jgi:hypothetical protein